MSQRRLCKSWLLEMFRFRVCVTEWLRIKVAFGIDSGPQSPFTGWVKVRTKSNGMFWVTVNVGRVWDKGNVGHSVKIVKRPTLGFYAKVLQKKVGLRLGFYCQQPCYDS